MKTQEFAIEPYKATLPSSRDLLAVLFRQRWTMLIAFAIAIVAVAVSGLWIPSYDAQMKILVRRQRTDAIVSPSANAPAQNFNDQVSEEDLNSEVELLNSQDLLRKVVLMTGLAGTSGTQDDRATEIKLAKAVRDLGRDLKIEPLRKTNVISIHYRAKNPQLAEKVLTALSTAYTEKHLQVHRSSGELKFFDQQMAQYEKGLNDAQAKLKDFSKGTGVVSAELERDSALKQAEDFDATARQAQTSLEETEQRVKVLEAQLQSVQPRTMTVVRTSDNPQLLEHLKGTLLNLQLKRTELLTKYEPTYRLVQEVDQEITDTKTAISSAESKPLRDEASDQNPDYQWVRGELTKAQAELSGLKSRAASAAAVAARYHQVAQQLNQDGIIQQDLQRTAKTQEDNYFLYLQKREEARISDALDQRGIVNVALAEKPIVPALPVRAPLNIALLTLVLAGTISLSAAFVVDFMDPSFRTPEELANYLGAPVLASLPKSEAGGSLSTHAG